MPMQVNYSKGTANGAVIKRIIGETKKEEEPVFNFIKLSHCDQDTTDYYLNHLTENFVVTGDINNYKERQLLYYMGIYCNANKIELNRVINITQKTGANYIDASYMFQNSPNLETVGGSGCFKVNVPIKLNCAFANCPKLKSIDMSIFQGTDNGIACVTTESMFNASPLLEEITNLDLQNVTSGCSNMFGANTSNAPKLKKITFKKGTVFAKYYTNTFTISFAYVTTLTRDALMEMLDSMGTNDTGYDRKIMLNDAVYALLSEDDISAFAAKNYTVVYMIPK